MELQNFKLHEIVLIVYAWIRSLIAHFELIFFQTSDPKTLNPKTCHVLNCSTSRFWTANFWIRIGFVDIYLRENLGSEPPLLNQCPRTPNLKWAPKQLLSSRNIRHWAMSPTWGCCRGGASELDECTSQCAQAPPRDSNSRHSQTLNPKPWILHHAENSRNQQTTSVPLETRFAVTPANRPRTPEWSQNSAKMVIGRCKTGKFFLNELMRYYNSDSAKLNKTSAECGCWGIWQAFAMWHHLLL